MKYLLNAKQMKEVDRYTIEDIGIPSLVLMERAALSVTNRLCQALDERNESYDNQKVLCICGRGNNGADGLAVARQLNERGICCEVMVIGKQGETGTEEYEKQLQIVQKLGVVIRNNTDLSEYNVIVDAIFGIGLSRIVEGEYEELINRINELSEKKNSLVVAVDIPSGVNATNGKIMNCAVKADITVTFGYDKVGLKLYPGADYAGKVYVENIGFVPDAHIHTGITAFSYSDDDLKRMPERDVHGNKGSFGKIFIIAGSQDMGGAACMSALAAYRSGCGLVKLFTHVNNRNLVLSHVPEAIMECYEDENEYNALENAQLSKMIENSIEWSTCVIIGPGISTSSRAVEIVKCVVDKMHQDKERMYIVDADALNIIASNERLKEKFKENAKKTEGRNKNIIITPHMGEMQRLINVPIAEIKAAPMQYAKETSNEFGVICVLKDAKTVVADGNDIYINTSGNAGMATAGSGDVLTGVIAGVMNLQKENNHKAVSLGVYIHGRAGDMAKQKYGEVSMKAMDIAEALSDVFSVKNHADAMF